MKARDAREKEALEWATNALRGYARTLTAEGSKRHREVNILWATLWVYDKNGFPEGREAWLRSELEGAKRDPGRLCNFAAALIERGDSLPPEIRGFVADYLRGRTPKIKRKSGPGPRSNLMWRNYYMMLAAAHLVECWGVPLTRNEASEHPSAASIVVEALKSLGDCLTESAVNSIFRTSGAQQYFRTLDGVQYFRTLTAGE